MAEFSHYYIENIRLDDLLGSLYRNFNIFLPTVKETEKEGKDYFYTQYPLARSFIFNPYRVIPPVKSFLTYTKELVSRYFTEEGTESTDKRDIVFGLKSCDLYSLKIQDYVFLEGVEVDQLYAQKRRDTILVSGDCASFKETCFCLALGVQPYPQEGFDLNLSPLGDGYVVEVGSEKGEELVDQNKELFTPAEESQIHSRKTKRDALVKQLEGYLLPKGLPPRDSLQRIVKDGYEADTWQKFMLTCVECGGCNFICSTCHCFLLTDSKEGELNVKLRLWDSCQYANFARVAGGANPLGTRARRLRNRFLKKFDFFVDNIGLPACCGCGRCIEVCPGKIDIRDVLKDLSQKVLGTGL